MKQSRLIARIFSSIANRVVAHPPRLYRLLSPKGIWRLQGKKYEKIVYLTFDDGPIPEVTPFVLDTLQYYGIKATFFMVGENAQRHSNLLQEVIRRGHAVGNHTMHHSRGLKTDAQQYLIDVNQAHNILKTRLFRPPHGLLKRKQSQLLAKNFTIIMYDVVSRDYALHITQEEVLQNVIRHTRPGSIIVFHDSLKAMRNLQYALPKAIEWLQANGYSFEALPME